ncbi:MAG: type II toxin-antitoxin system Phd/YefM family antitoxin, partial [Actinomycetota bacterium]
AMEVTIKAWNTRNASARELARRTSALLDEIDEKGTAIVIVRFGRPAALLVPLEQTRQHRQVVIQEAGPGLSADEFEMPQLRDYDERLLAEMYARSPEPVGREDDPERATAFVRLQLEGLVEEVRGVRPNA